MKKNNKYNYIINIFNKSKQKIKPNIVNIKKIVKFILQKENKKKSLINIIFVDDKKIKDINTKYLGKNNFTDVIAFSEIDNIKSDSVEGDIFISVDTARNNAKKYDNTFCEEILRLIIHGILHVMGYDHLNPKDRKKMKPKEEKYYKLLIINCGGKK